MSEQKQDPRLLSAGRFSGERIGRPTVVYDQRTKFATDLSGFEKAIKERKNIGFDQVADKVDAPMAEDQD